MADSILTLTADLTPTPPYRPFTTLASIGPFAETFPHRPQPRARQRGYVEIRARCTNDPWTKLALWFMNLESSNCRPGQRNCSILNAEWDMVENGIRTWDGPTGSYLDGQLLGSQPTYDTAAQPMYMLLTAAPSNSQPPANPPKPESMETQIDWVRVWQQ